MLYLISAGEDLFPTSANTFHQFPLLEKFLNVSFTLGLLCSTVLYM